MSGRGFRAIMCSAASGAGPWAVAAGLLTHHPLACVIGALVAINGAILVLAEPANHPSEDSTR